MRKIVPFRFTTLVSLAVIVALPFLAGCRAEEQNRITKYEPGVYLGKKQAALTDEQVRSLRYRVRGQAGSTSTVGSN